MRMSIANREAGRWNGQDKRERLLMTRSAQMPIFPAGARTANDRLREER